MTDTPTARPRLLCGQCGSDHIIEDRSVTLDAEGEEARSAAIALFRHLREYFLKTGSPQYHNYIPADTDTDTDTDTDEVPTDADEVLPCGCPAPVVTDEGHQEGCATGELLKTLDLTPAMVDVLMVDDPAEVHTTDKMLNLVGLTQRGLAVVVSSLDPGRYRLTDAGARARAVILPAYTALKGTTR